MHYRAISLGPRAQTAPKTMQHKHKQTFSAYNVSSNITKM